MNDSTRTSFLGCEAPAVPGGYLSWREPVTDHWWQQVWFDTAKPQFRDLGKLAARAGSLRSAIDSRTKTALRIADSGPQSDRFTSAKTLTALVKKSTTSRADAWRTQIQGLQSGQTLEGTWEGGARDHG
ncbi:hypothetical protein G3I60_03485 [Streptomyces sp. SID13666]|uniref:hypothetical protein n=1 Tax=unclassified Streptomyces TaxID=2593676 RepID=UPI0013C0BB45|nr:MULTISPECIES: hypothetical protein [unclassified Streptomyces]NEA53253.1 hypothetical protein [Streptomyces sp. SID13666]NEA69420.1 hypothetical protein [Streptomyces sp. SID13588]